MKSAILFGILTLIGLLKTTDFQKEEVLQADISNKTVFEILDECGDSLPDFFIANLDSAKIRQGEDLVTIGYTRLENSNTKRISKHFVCINCHNVVKESNQLTNPDTEVRLEYMMENKIPFLPASTLYGVVNRTAYFNGDYKKKYGPKAEEAKHDLRKAIQVCAEISSEGRILEKWEIESILHYLNSIQLKIGDLNLNSQEFEKITKQRNKATVEILKQKYLAREKATFGFPLASNVRELGAKGDWKKGEYIFKFGCMHCHNPEGITIFTLEADQFNRNFLKNRMKKTNKKSIYEITRTGTHPKKIKKTYMPLYTYEKLSDKQLEHLAAYLNYKP